MVRYLSPRYSQGFSDHTDNKDGFIIQISGAKHWSIFNSTFIKPMRSQMLGTCLSKFTMFQLINDNQGVHMNAMSIISRAMSCLTVRIKILSVYTTTISTFFHISNNHKRRLAVCPARFYSPCTGGHKSGTPSHDSSKETSMMLLRLPYTIPFPLPRILRYIC